MSEEDFQKFDKGITHSDSGIRTEGGKLSTQPDISPLDPEEEQRDVFSDRELEYECRRYDYLDRAEREQRINDTVDALSTIADSVEIIAAFLTEHPEVVEGLIKFGYKARDFAVSSYTKLSSHIKQIARNRKEKPWKRLKEVSYEVEIYNDSQERIPISEEEARYLLDDMRETARKLAAEMYLWSVISIKDEKSDTEYVMEQSLAKELLSSDVHNTIETLVANRNLLEESVAKTLSDFLDGYLTNNDRRIPIPLLIEEKGNTESQKEIPLSDS